MVSRNTLLRGLRRLPVPVLPTPRVMGVDDWALRKRQTYGTILVDLERRQPVALLPESHRRDCGAVATGAPRGGGDRTGSVHRLCRGRTARGLGPPAERVAGA